MKKGKQIYLVIFIILTSVFLLVGCQAANKEVETSGSDESSIKIGFVTNLSVGGATEQGLATRNGFELAIKEINEAGGVLGKPIEIVIYDDQAKPEVAVEHVTRLVNQDKVSAITGFVNSGNALASQHIAQEAKVPLIVNYATATDITTMFQGEEKNYIFRYSLLDGDQVTKMLDFVEANKFEKIGILHDTSGYGVNGMQDIVSQMEERGITHNMIETLNTNDTDMTSQLQKFKREGIDVVMLYALSPENANSVRSAEKIDYDPTFIGPWSSSFSTYRRLAGDLRNGTYMTTGYVVGQSPKSTQLNENMIKVHGEDVLPIASAFGYDSAYLIAQAITEANSSNPEMIRDALEGIEVFEGAVGKIEKPFSKMDHEAISVDHIFVAVWENGEIKKLDPQPQP